jgi:hypothetical protein
MSNKPAFPEQYRSSRHSSRILNAKAKLSKLRSYISAIGKSASDSRDSTSLDSVCADGSVGIFLNQLSSFFNGTHTRIPTKRENHLNQITWKITDPSVSIVDDNFAVTNQAS